MVCRWQVPDGIRCAYACLYPTFVEYCTWTTFWLASDFWTEIEGQTASFEFGVRETRANAEADWTQSSREDQPGTAVSAVMKYTMSDSDLIPLPFFIRLAHFMLGCLHCLMQARNAFARDRSDRRGQLHMV